MRTVLPSGSVVQWYRATNGRLVSPISTALPLGKRSLKIPVVLS